MMNSKELESGHKSIRGTLRKPFPSSRHCQVHPASHPYSSQIQITNTFRKIQIYCHLHRVTKKSFQTWVQDMKLALKQIFPLSATAISHAFAPQIWCIYEIHLQIKDFKMHSLPIWSNASIVAHYVSNLLHIALVIRNVKEDIWTSSTPKNYGDKKCKKESVSLSALQRLIYSLNAHMRFHISKSIVSTDL